MAASSKPPGVKNKTQQKRPLCKQVLVAPVAAQWPPISEAQVRRIKQAIQDAAHGLGDRKRIQPPWRELRKFPKEKRAEVIKKFQEDHLSRLDKSELETFLRTQQTKKTKLTEIIFGYNEIMRHLIKGTLAAVLVNKSATPEFLAKSFLPGCYCRSIPVVAIENLQEIFGKCIGVGFKDAVKEKSSAFHTMFTLMKDDTNSVHAPQPSTASFSSDRSDSESKPETVKSKRCNKTKNPPVVDASSFHLIRGSVEQTAFFSKFNSKHWTSDVISLSSDIPHGEKDGIAFDFRRKKLSKPSKSAPSAVLGEGEGTECQESLSTAMNMEDVTSMFELDYSGENENGTDMPASVKAGQDTAEESHVESPALNSSVNQKSDSLTEVSPGEKQTKSIKRRAKEVEEKITGAPSYVPAAVTRVIGNPKRKKHKDKWWMLY